MPSCTTPSSPAPAKSTPPGGASCSPLSGAESPREALAKQLGMTEGALKVAVHRLRQRYREVLRAEIADTVDSPADVGGEIRHLVAVLRS